MAEHGGHDFRDGKTHEALRVGWWGTCMHHIRRGSWAKDVKLCVWVLHPLAGKRRCAHGIETAALSSFVRTRFSAEGACYVTLR